MKKCSYLQQAQIKHALSTQNVKQLASLAPQLSFYQSLQFGNVLLLSITAIKYQLAGNFHSPLRKISRISLWPSDNATYSPISQKKQRTYTRYSSWNVADDNVVLQDSYCISISTIQWLSSALKMLTNCCVPDTVVEMITADTAILHVDGHFCNKRFVQQNSSDIVKLRSNLISDKISLSGI